MASDPAKARPPRPRGTTTKSFGTGSENHDASALYSRNLARAEVSGDDILAEAPETTPTPFPVELPRRFIELYTYEDEVVLDPFIGSGSTAVAALRSGRRYVGYETNEEYVAPATTRLAAEGGEA